MLNPGPFCYMMEERRRRLIKWPGPTVDKTRRKNLPSHMVEDFFLTN